MKQNSKS